ncbi:MAG: sigma-54 dependent transcriptional regulator [Bacteroidales bacterium]|mgnify:CR=1 FL=1|nr:sigma-54 dependent transcriptional regulator [Bacteroidales bacterium]
MKNIKIFVVEDDPMYSKILQYHLSQNPDYDVFVFNNGKSCLEKLYEKPDIVTLDYSLPDLSGFEVLSKIQEFNPEIPVIIISGQEDVTTAVNLLKEGAYDYITKDENTKDRIWNSIKNIREKLSLKEEISELREEIGRKYEFNKIIKGNSPALKHVFNLMEKAAKTNITVSITGETGTGKELVAKAIHYNSRFKNKPFVTVNVSAIPKELIESEMFGHEKGAFTGAHERRIGKFEEAHKGTIFLDEIGEMDMSMQTKLLRVLQEKELTRVGSNKVIKIETRVIVATHKNLLQEVKNGNFREDLYYRLLGLPIELPPLRDRGNDILILAKHFVEEFAKENEMGEVSITNEAQEKLLKYPYPGNVRELRAVIELATVMSNNGQITADDINFYSTSSMNDLLLEETTLKEYERRIIKNFLKKYNNDILLVAKKLDVGKSTIYRMKKNGEI